jgi:hypothetical protein
VCNQCVTVRHIQREVFFFFLVGLGVELMALCFAKHAVFCLSHTSSPFCSGLEVGVSWTICLGWPWTSILLISASQVAGITVWARAPSWKAFSAHSTWLVLLHRRNAVTLSIFQCATKKPSPPSLHPRQSSFAGEEWERKASSFHLHCEMWK